MEQSKKKVFLDQLGYAPHVRRLVAEVPVDWTNDDIGRLTGYELFCRFGTINDDWEDTDEGVLPQNEIELVGPAPDNAVPDVVLDGPPHFVSDDTCPECGLRNTNEIKSVEIASPPEGVD